MRIKSRLAVVALGTFGIAVIVVTGVVRRLFHSPLPAAAVPISNVSEAAPSSSVFAVREREAAATDTTGASVLPDALAGAVAIADPTRRIEGVAIALRQWAAHDAEAAGSWALLHCPIPRSIAMAAVINGAAAQSSDIAERVVRQFSERDPERAGEYGTYLISAFGEAGEHQRAAAWALSGADDPALDWTTAAYHRWAAHEPEVALLSAAAVTEPLRRRAAVEAAIGAWARSRPQALAECAVSFPPGPEKNLALVSALRAWAEAEPGETANWIQTHRDMLAGLDRLETVLEE
jgi:hypothetical protein